ncbi:hypothetical protein MLD38_035345 [Melastoma candidum]|uniref:Uncharacterized protein n=1 Tax=Melastoma candidum TaxID=119954 RepID=A0ACB9LHK5_9MYRT|nr:hypothetical protein MLD38_035345 [Melastoma candidum]
MEGYKTQSPQPFVPSKLHPRSDHDHDPYPYPYPYHYPLPPFTPSRGPARRRPCNKCLFYFLAFFVALCIGLLVFSLVVLRPDSPSLHIEIATVKNLAYDASSWESPFLNMTLDAGLSLRNRNYGRYEFTGNGSVLGLACEGIVLGEKKNLRGGSVGGRETGRIRVEMVVGYSGGGAGMAAAGNLSRGIDERMLKLRSYGRIAGKVHLLKYLKRSLSSEMNCTLTLNLSTKNFQDLVCQ